MINARDTIHIARSNRVKRGQIRWRAKFGEMKARFDAGTAALERAKNWAVSAPPRRCRPGRPEDAALAVHRGLMESSFSERTFARYAKAIRFAQIHLDPEMALRANDGETSESLKFSLEGEGQPSWSCNTRKLIPTVLPGLVVTGDRA